MRKSYISGLAVLGAMSVILTGSAAFAQTNSGNNQNWQRGQGGVERGMMRPGVFGKVTAINGSSLTVTDDRSNTSYTVDASSATVTKSGSTSSLSSIAVGDNVAVQGTVSGTSVKAAAIRDGVGTMGMGRGPEGRVPGVFGKVTAINGNTLTVTSQRGPEKNDDSGSASSITYTVDASSAKVIKNGSTSSLSNIAVGDAIMVEGTISGTTVSATTIRDGFVQDGKGRPEDVNPIIQGNGQPIVAGSVTTISGNTLTITNKSNVTYTIDVTNAKVQKNNATSSVSNIATGDSVIVQGVVNGNSVSASSVIDQGQQAQVNGQSGTGSNTDTPKSRGFFGGIVQFFAHLFGF